MNTFLALKLVHLKPFERLLYNVFITVNLQFLIFAKEVESGCVPKYSGPRLMMDRYLAGPQISWNPLSLSSAFIQFDSLCGCGDQGRGHQDTRRLGYLTSATQKISRVAENIPTELQLALDLGLRAAAEVVTVADAGVNLGSAQARAHTGDRTFTSGERRIKIISE